jgi:outer membrane immunogenic protein
MGGEMKREPHALSGATPQFDRVPLSSWIAAWHRLALSCVILAASTGLAGAADIAVPPPPDAPTWTGCYVGGHGGYGATKSNSFYSSPVSPVLDVNGFFTAGLTVQTFDNKGLAGGGQAGCQQQMGGFIWGLEADWSSFSNNASQVFSNSFDEGGGVTFSQTFNQSLGFSSLWSIRGRFGFVVSEVYHLYVTAGVGGAKANYAYSGSFRETGAGGCVCGSIAGNVSISPTGLVLGVGAEWKAWSNIILGAEYLHYDLTSDTVIPFFTAALNPLIALGDHARTKSADVVRVRLSWLVNPWR